MRLKDKVAVITGGARGIGKKISEIFLSEGAQVNIFDINESEGNAAARELGLLYNGGRVTFFKADITDENDIEGSIESIIKTSGKIDILVNNAGITLDNLVLRMSVADWKKVIDINLTGAFICSKIAVKHMMKRHAGKIINISSIVGVHGNIGQANYSASKAGLIGLTKTLAREMAVRNIQVNAIAPGYIKTDMTEKIPDKIKDKLIEQIPARNLGSAEDVARAVLFLASSESDYITGTVVSVDGGMGI
ncbi:MAG: 3-oxoacyl-[acyl-carrier-protein] reductase [Actinobacteria bacterium]|nr:3-oxoacyl-[acyl-carrier-protein] reductase [Actinomycetota bacterium]